MTRERIKNKDALKMMNPARIFVGCLFLAVLNKIMHKIMHSYLCCLEGDEVRVLCFGNTVDDSAEHTTVTNAL